MDIKKTWQEIDREEEDVFPENIPGGSSSHPLAELKKNLLYHTVLGTAICAGFIAVMLIFPLWQMQVAMGLVLAFSFWTIYTAIKLYRDIDPGISANSSLLAEMEKQHGNFTRWMNTQQRIALFFYPVSVAGGFMLGGYLGSGKTVSEFMDKPVIWLILAITIAIVTPMSWLFSKWTFNYSFGKILKRLEENIADLKKDEF